LAATVAFLELTSDLRVATESSKLSYTWLCG